jgi:glycosyltransferase involved in cell wall biosynthesis
MSGAEISLIGLLSNLDRNIFSPVVVCPQSGELPQELHRLGIQTEFLDFVRIKRDANKIKLTTHLFQILKTIPELTALVSKYNINVIHSNNTTAHLYGMPAAKLSRIPSIWTIRDLVPLGRLGRLLYKFSGRIIVPSESCAEILQTEKDDKIRKIYNGIDLEKWCGQTPENDGSALENKIRLEFGIGRDETLIAMVGQLVPWKGHRYLLAAAGLFIKQFANVKILIVGEDIFSEHPDYKKELINICRNSSLQDNVIFTGHRSDIFQLMRGIDILVLPSLQEPFGRVILEAMACEKPVVATNSGGPREIIRDGVEGILVPESDAEQIAEAVIRLIGDEQLRKDMGRAGRSRVETGFDIRKKVEETEGLYRELTC